MAKILIIEDDTFLRDIYVDKLSQNGFEVIVSSDGQDGISKIKEEKPDLVLLDIVLPKKDGFEVLEEVKNTPGLSNIPIVLLSNLSQKKEVDKAMSLGARDYVIKAHFTPTAVMAKIKEILSKG